MTPPIQPTKRAAFPGEYSKQEHDARALPGGQGETSNHECMRVLLLLVPNTLLGLNASCMRLAVRGLYWRPSTTVILSSCIPPHMPPNKPSKPSTPTLAIGLP
eukprot:1155807-Pelagomonas_calceolata.AAC.9